MKKRLVAVGPKRTPPPAAKVFRNVGLPADVASDLARALAARHADVEYRRQLRGLVADLKRNAALCRRVAHREITPNDLLDLSSEDRQTDERQSKKKPKISHENESVELAKGYECEECHSSKITAQAASFPTTSYGTSEVRDVLFLSCLDCRHTWKDGDVD